MSERGSFVTEYIYCDRCFNACKEVLCKNEKYLKGIVIPSWKNENENLPIIAGKIGGMYANEECNEMDLDVVASKVKGEEGTAVELEFLKMTLLQ